MRPFAVPFLACATLALGAGCHSLFLRPDIAGETRVETASFVLRTDLGAEGRGKLLGVAEEVRLELEEAYPAPGGAGAEGRREIIAFASLQDFRRYLHAHLFAQDRAIGFYCDLGGECALTWRDPPGPEDIRVLRHELTHQHLAARFAGRIPAWLEEGVAEWHALGQDERATAPEAVALALKGEEGASAARRAVGEGGTPAWVADCDGWRAYRERRFAADAVFAAHEVRGGRRSWPDARDAPASRVPPPTWARGEGGYVPHLLFIRFLESIGEGREGALGACLARAAEGKSADLDVSRRFRTVGELEDAFNAYVLREEHDALEVQERGADGRLRAQALDRPGARGGTARSAASSGAAAAPESGRLSLPSPAAGEGTLSTTPAPRSPAGRAP